jgi:hypothetical protein
MRTNTLQPPRPLCRLAAELGRAPASGGRHATSSVFHQRYTGRLLRSSRNGHGRRAAQLPLALAELGLIDEYEFVVQPRLAGHGPTLFAGLSKHVDLKLVSLKEFASRAVAMRYEPKR